MQPFIRPVLLLVTWFAARCVTIRVAKQPHWTPTGEADESARVTVRAQYAHAMTASAPDGAQAKQSHEGQKPPAMLPLGQGAYQDPNAVAQRTRDKRMHCEEWNLRECYGEDGDLFDGHNFGNFGD